MTNKKIRLGPIIIGVKNIEMVKSFYVNVFEIEIKEESDHYLSAYLGDTHIEIEEDSENRFPNWAKHNVGTYKCSEFFVDDISIFLEKVRANGGKIINDPIQRPWGLCA